MRIRDWDLDRESRFAPFKHATPTAFLAFLGPEFTMAPGGEAKLDALFAVIAMSPQHTFLLAGWPERIREYLARRDADLAIAKSMYELPSELCPHDVPVFTGWPLPNVWIGAQAPNDELLAENAAIVLDTPAVFRFVWADPLEGPLDSLAELSEPETCVACQGQGSVRVDGFIDQLRQCPECIGSPAGLGRLPGPFGLAVVGGLVGWPPREWADQWLIERCPAKCGSTVRKPVLECQSCRGERYTPKIDARVWVAGIRRAMVAAGGSTYFRQWGGPKRQTIRPYVGGRLYRELPTAESVQWAQRAVRQTETVAADA